MLLCIDAGHCNLTPGKRAFDSSFFEYEFNYDVATRVKSHLQRHGVEVWLQQIVNSNPTTELNTRIKNINAKKPDLVVSIHANAYGTTWNTANGWEIYCSNPTNKSAKGTKLAQSIHDASIPYLGLKDRGIKDAHGVAGIVTSTTPPAVLIEHGFYTNKDELAKLKDTNFRDKCAIADAKGILSYLGIKWIEPNVPSVTQESEDVNMKRYDKLADIPEWYQADIKELIDAGILKGHSDGSLDLTEDMIRVLIINKRLVESKLK